MTDLPPVRRLGDVDTGPLVDRAQGVPSDVLARVRDILAAVQAEGDQALRRYTQELDGADLEDPWLDEAAWQAAAATVPADLRAAIDRNMARIEAFHRLQQASEATVETAPGLRLGRRPVPFARVACYVPGGRASYPSTVLMTVAPARLAGCKEIVVATPPRPDGSVDPVVLYAAKAAGATAVLRAGGAQAVAALAFGTERVAAVRCIVGPGNAYVTAAKQSVGHRVRIDSPAGPSELLVIADDTAPPQAVALDLLAQAEHDPDAQVILVATDEVVAAAVRDQVARRLPKEPRRDIIHESLRDHGAFLVADLDGAVAFANAYGPEHLALMTRDPRGVLDRITAAGSVFLGPHTPVTLGDYGSGTNHVLPTMGYARVRGGLSLEDFRTWVTWQEATPAGLQGVGPDMVRLADAEGFAAHAQAVRARMDRAGGDERP